MSKVDEVKEILAVNVTEAWYADKADKVAHQIDKLYQPKKQPLKPAPRFDKVFYEIANRMEYLIMQAEISFKAGYDEGIGAGDYYEGLVEGEHIGKKEVVDWIEAHSCPDGEYEWTAKEWQRQVKEWSRQ